MRRYRMAESFTAKMSSSAANGTNTPPQFESERILKNLPLVKPFKVSEETTVLDVCKMMAAICVDVVLVANTDDWISGIVTEKDIATKVIAEGLRPDQTLISKVMTRNLIYAGSDASAMEALQLMAIGNFRHLPVVENNAIIGLLDITNCLYDAISIMGKVAKQGSVIVASVEGVEYRYGSNLLELSNFMGMFRENMFKSSLSTIILEGSRVAIVSPSDTVYVAAKIMRDSCVSYVLIMTGNNIHGILTSKDILIRVVAQDLSPEVTLVVKVMTPDPKCTTLDTTIFEALNIMHDGKLLYLPVVDKDGNVAACFDVLWISYGAIFKLGSIFAASTDALFTVMRKILDSELILKPAYYSDTESEINMSPYVPSYGTHHLKPSYLVENSFSFKLKDHKGRLHRFNSGTNNLAKLVYAVMQRVGVYIDQKRFRLLYEDDEGEKVLLTMDEDLVAAVVHAKSVGQKVLKMDLEYYDSSQEKEEITTKNHICSFLFGVLLFAVFFYIPMKTLVERYS
ncbi:CBS domain-containing protein CBSCBSPB3-like isoform X2 [Salvia miltiorrhiza]|uniref:CBS domain-containing protein CBSCBSPB3-like isoform X2 n=1 Tax=Salvia miltiorrhiza TaxID=226208 RepID=UPI0025ACE414|nr:CBS domain-containing protein CBSCBSPB3-like isoform X2 [Salvia miltiorrhiza]XP_057806099.1 CBS domain-containing protein CBSCBSPB3-like isoform X2 [Salvia miltiorrhiza]